MCEAEIRAHGIGPADFNLIDFIGEAVFVEDRSLDHGLLPVFAGSAPIGSEIAQRQPDSRGGHKHCTQRFSHWLGQRSQEQAGREQN